jgi:hemoglobin-like flavoprotein
MTPDQCLRIRASMEAIRDIKHPFVLLFYGKLFELDPSLRMLFDHDLGAQGRKLMRAIDSLSQSVTNLECIYPMLHELGRRHAQYGVRSEHYETLAFAFNWTLAQALGADFDLQTHMAWKAVIHEASAAMKAGANTPPPAW